jgi:hypothetical protein
MSFIECSIVTGVILICSLVNGRALVAALNIRLLGRLTVENAAASTIAGLAVAVLAFGFASYLGLHASIASCVVLALFALMMVLAWHGGRVSDFRPRGFFMSWTALAILCGSATTMSLLPIFRGDGYDCFNDTLFYCFHSEWLQQNGFGTPSPRDPLVPIDESVHLFQKDGMRIGPSFMLAIVQILSLTPCSLVVFPSVMASAMVMTMLAIFLAGRWILRLPADLLLLGCTVVSIFLHPLYWALHNGFLAQLLGLPAFILAFSVIARATHQRWWTWPHAWLIAICCAYALTVYSEIFPFVAIVGVWCVAKSLRRAIRLRISVRLLRFVGIAAVVFVALGVFEIPRFNRSIRGQLVSLAGWHIAMTPPEWLQFSMGTRVYRPVWDSERPMRMRVCSNLGYLGAAFAIAGLLRCFKTPRGSGVLVIVFVFSAMTVYHLMVTPDPWTKEMGHTWSLFKIAQWAYPWTVLLQLAGIFLVVRVFALRRLTWPLAAAGFIAMGYVVFPLHWNWAKRTSDRMHVLFPCDRPLSQIGKTKKLLTAGSGPLWVVDRLQKEDQHMAGCIALLAFPRQVRGNWKGVLHLDYRVGRWETPSVPDGHDTAITWGTSLPYESDVTDSLGSGITRLPRDGVVVTEVANAVQVEHGVNDMPVLWLGSWNTEIAVFSPQPAEGELVLETFAGPSIPETQVRNLTLRVGDRPPMEFRATDTSQVRIPISLAAGSTKIHLSSPDKPSIGMNEKYHPPRLLAITRAAFEVSPSKPSSAESSTRPELTRHPHRTTVHDRVWDPTTRNDGYALKSNCGDARFTQVISIIHFRMASHDHVD